MSKSRLISGVFIAPKTAALIVAFSGVCVAVPASSQVITNNIQITTQDVFIQRRRSLDIYLKNIKDRGKITSSIYATAISILIKISSTFIRAASPTASYSEDGTLSLIWNTPKKYMHLEISENDPIYFFGKDKEENTIWDSEWETDAAFPIPAQAIFAAL